MARTIYLKKEEKLAMLRIMVNISNHYNERLPDIFKAIQETAVLFNMPIETSEVDKMSVSEAQNIIYAFKYDSLKRNFLKELLGKMLQFSNSGIFQKIEDEDYEVDAEDIMNAFKSEWSYVYQLLGDIISFGDKEDKDLFTIDMISWRYIHQHFEDWIVADKQGENNQEKKEHEISGATIW